MLNWLRRSLAYLVPTSAAGKAAATTGFLLVSTVIAAVVLPMTLGMRGLFRLGEIPIISVLIGIITGLVYTIVRFWGEQEASKYPHIDQAWRSGIAALDNLGISLSEGTEPLFLVLGSGSVEAAFVESMRASGVSFRVCGVPGSEELDPVLRWYVSDSAIYLFCSGVGALANLTQQRKAPRELPGEDWNQSVGPSEIGLGNRAASRRYDVSVNPLDLETSLATITDSGTSFLPSAQAAARFATQFDISGEQERVSYLCGLIRRNRWPRCGINGSVVLLPFDLAVANNHELESMVEAIQADTETIHRTLQLRYPLSGMVIGMERAVGFKEFANLLDKTQVQMRLGASFNLHRWPTPERLQLFSDKICDSFEDFVYALFGRPGALDRPAENRKLFRLLCWVRSEVKPKLNRMLATAFGGGGRRSSATLMGQQDGLKPVFFSGCYLAATGKTAGEGQAFVKGVLGDKLVKEQGKVEWTEQARRAQLLFKIAVWVGWAVFVCLLGALGSGLTVLIPKLMA